MTVPARLANVSCSLQPGSQNVKSDNVRMICRTVVINWQPETGREELLSAFCPKGVRTLSMNSHQASARAEALFKKEEPPREAPKAMAGYESDLHVMREKTARLRELRLARAATNNQTLILSAEKRSLPAKKRSASAS
jgi:hypothetical protein